MVSFMMVGCDGTPGDHVGSSAQMHEGLKLLREQAQTVYLPLMRVRLAVTMADDGRHDAAVATIDAELAGMKEGGQCWFSPRRIVHTARSSAIGPCRS
jgi:hypothetical protein